MLPEDCHLDQPEKVRECFQTLQLSQESRGRKKIQCCVVDMVKQKNEVSTRCQYVLLSLYPSFVILPRTVLSGQAKDTNLTF
jgi:hypothetical protein